MTQAHDGGWIPVRKDFVDPATRCHARGASRRHHGFPEGQAFILRDAAGHEYPFGEDCARAALAQPALLRQVPDYTERDMVPRTALPELPAGPRRRDPAQARAAERAAAIRYLVLRMEKVAAVPRVQPTVRFPALEDVYAQYQRSGDIAPAQVRRILAIERSPSTPPRLRAINLLDVYTAHVKLERLIAASTRVDNIRFLRSLHDWLARHLVLTAGQLAAAGIAMHPQAFTSAGIWGAEAEAEPPPAAGKPQSGSLF
ncbi:hypothetical protein [Cupriavidus taiwanensis]|uniref:hypothetical protein n=1 Tax=Cupriavidus taiwanensis TaxID=164546 RepID=UPI000E10BA4D|nr:hypothetical protein [Cupriavidus taiwanensis]SOY43127.1 conserved hypothetical protein [Cupriavidus taiwanensis]SOY45390.1 conserved hypothetical protein [Cupriavidus taiwanensis]SOY80961.1 conserved hypothetical protein [Cupriavidus taiwanensis]SOZ53284.1 conserved hypothetical protein [Cupriavidus taiwanensis]SOZ77504.1 conserved hypothetical protein [Cupriavidus taiwanensis]